MRKVFYGEPHIGVLEKRIALVAVQIERRGDDRLGAHNLAHPSRKLRLWTRDMTCGHRAVDTEVDAVERPFGLELSDHCADEGFKGVLRYPT